VGEETRGDTRQYLAYLQKLAHELRIEHLVHFRPFIEQTEKVYAILDVFVMASLKETYGTVTIEAMAAGLPIIGTNTGGTPELLEYGRLGILIPPTNEKEMANALEKLYTSKNLREQYGNIARKSAKNRFAYQIQCKQMEELIDKVLKLDR
jgi:glycosyltransferase involved in cell wall biosynthesis